MNVYVSLNKNNNEKNKHLAGQYHQENKNKIKVSEYTRPILAVIVEFMLLLLPSPFLLAKIPLIQILYKLGLQLSIHLVYIASTDLLLYQPVICKFFTQPTALNYCQAAVIKKNVMLTF